jgi:hypothetical protein
VCVCVCVGGCVREERKTQQHMNTITMGQPSGFQLENGIRMKIKEIHVYTDG